MLGVCKDTNVGQADCVGHGGHGGFVLRAEDAVGRGTRRGGETCKVCFLVREDSGRG